METREVISAENCETKQAAKGTRCHSLPVCTVRTRIAILLAMFCLQAPFLLYYMSSVDLSNILILKSYGSNLRIFSNYGNDKYSKDDITAVANSSTVLNSIKNATTSTIYNSTFSGVANSDAKNLPTSSATAKMTARTNTTAQVTAQSEVDGAILPLCPEEPPNLQGRLEVSFKNPPETFKQIAVDNSLLEAGGHGKPPYCKSRQKVALIIPFRDRSEHLRYFLQYMHPTLQRQEVDYQIFIINQVDGGKFNRAKLMNVGFTEALKIYPFDCFAFHDVDLILEDDRCLYWCSDRPRHMSVAVDKFNYVLPYTAIFGGVVLVSKEQMEKGNGFSNSFWGWGGEDDDFRNRLTSSGYKIIRYSNNIARYKMISHQRERGNEPNPKRFAMIQKTKTTMLTDGLNSLDYKVIEIDFEPTYTNITVDIFPP